MSVAPATRASPAAISGPGQAGAISVPAAGSRTFRLRNGAGYPHECVIGRGGAFLYTGGSGFRSADSASRPAPGRSRVERGEYGLTGAIQPLSATRRREQDRPGMFGFVG